MIRAARRGRSGMRTLHDTKVATRLPAQDLDRARAWYSEKLGLEPSDERPGGLLYRMRNGEFALFASSGRPSGEHTQMGFEVDDIDATVAELDSRGISLERYPGFDHDEKGIVRDGEGPTVAWFEDPAGNVLSIFQE